MRNKIDYGIDLGTTNSAIARMENGVPNVKKTDTYEDTLPSCVHFNKRQDILVGRSAVNVMRNDNISLLARSESHAKIIENFCNRPVLSILDDWNYKQLEKL